jgi:uncharacterized membrane protein
MRVPQALRTHRFGILAAILAAIYGVLWGIIDSLLYRSFSLHIWDVGVNFVLPNFSAPPDLGHGHLIWAPQNLIYLFFTPIARAFPDPLLLVLVQDGLFALGGFFIFLVAVTVWNRPGLALLFEGLYLFNYALFGAPFFPNHYEVLFSVFFPIAFFLYLSRRVRTASVVLTLAALCSSLAAVDVVLFVLLFLWPELVPVLRNRMRGLGALLLRHKYPVAAGLLGIAIFVFPFATVGFAITVSYAHTAGGTSPDVLLGLETGSATKLAYLLLVFLPFIPILARSRYVLLTIPYVALVLVAGANNYDQFSYQYTYTVGAILFIAVIDALGPTYAVPPKVPSRAVTPPSPARHLRRRQFRTALRMHSELTQAAVVIIVLGFLILPYSPGNALAGPYASLPFRNYQLPSLVTVTPYDQALWEMAGRVPVQSSVLIQENMPVLTNRAVWYEPGSYNGEPVAYALADPADYWFVGHPPSFIGPYPVPMIQWVNELYANRSYGIVQEYQGAILFESGYRGAPSLFVPYETGEPGVAFSGPSVAYHVYGGADVSVTNAQPTAPAFFTEGTIILPPGNYTLTVELRSSSTNASNLAHVGVWSGSLAPLPFAVLALNGTLLSSGNGWSYFSLDFSIGEYVQGLRFGAYDTSWAGTLALNAVYLNQTSPG